MLGSFAKETPRPVSARRLRETAELCIRSKVSSFNLCTVLSAENKPLRAEPCPCDKLGTIQRRSSRHSARSGDQQVMSAQSQGRPVTLEGETSGPDYARGSGLEADGNTRPLLNGTEPEATRQSARVDVRADGANGGSSSVQHGVGVQGESGERTAPETGPATRATGLGTTTYGSAGQASVGGVASSSGLRGGNTQQAPRQPQTTSQQATQQLQATQKQPPQQPHPMPQQVPQQPHPVPQQMPQQSQPVQQQATQQLQPPLPGQDLQHATTSASTTSMPQEPPQESPTMPTVAMPALRLEAPRRPRLIYGPPGQGQDGVGDDVHATGPALSTVESFASARSHGTVEGGSRNVWWSFGEVFQRRVVDPVMNVGRTLSSTTPARPTTTTQQQLFQGDMQQALQVHQTRDSLISPQRRRQDEEGSASSLNQDMVLEEVRRQVQLAMQGRDQEVHALKQRNEELERALVEANSVMRVYGSGGGSRPAVAEPGGVRLNPPGAQAGFQTPAEDPGPRRGSSREPRGNLSGTGGGELREAGLKGPELPKPRRQEVPLKRDIVMAAVSRQLGLKEMGQWSLFIYL